MNFDMSYSLNLYTLVLLAILWATISIKKEDFKFSSKLLKLVITFTIMILVIEILSWAFDGINAGYAKILNYTFNLLFFLSGPIIVGLFASYVDYMNYRSRDRLKKRLYYMQLFVLFLTLGVVNIFTGIIFSIDALNVYTRGAVMNYCFASVFVLIIYMLGMTFSNHTHLEREVFISIFIFSLIPLVGGILQMFFFGLLIMWASVGLAVVVAYVYTEMTNNSKDYLTKLYSRQIMTEYLETLEQNDECFSLILFDLDDFKEINDTYGHREGDRILIHFSKILRDSVPKEAMLGRIGGDEFLVIIKCINPDVVRNLLDKLISLITKYNQDQDKIKIQFSHGVGTRQKGQDVSADDVFITCDKLMYAEKDIKKGREKRTVIKK